MESVEPAVLVARFTRGKDTLVVGLASGEQMIEAPRQFGGGGGDGFGGAEAGPPAALAVAEGAVTLG